MFHTSWIASQIYSLVHTSSNESVYPNYENDCAPSITGAVVNVNGTTVTKVSGDFPYIANPHDSPSFSVNTSTDTFTSSTTLQGLEVGNPVIFFGSNLPAPLVEQTLYWVVYTNQTQPNVIRISATKGGPILDITTPDHISFHRSILPGTSSKLVACIAAFRHSTPPRS